MQLTDQALGALMLALQNSLMNQTDIVPVLKEFNFTATDIFTDKKMEEICQSTHNINVPIVTKKEYQLVDIDEDGYITLFDEETNETSEDQKLRDKKIDVDIKKNFEEGKDLIVTVISAMGESAVIDFKESK